MRPGHRPPRDKRYFHAQKKYGNAARLQAKGKVDDLHKHQQRHSLKAQLKAYRRQQRR